MDFLLMVKVMYKESEILYENIIIFAFQHFLINVNKLEYTFISSYSNCGYQFRVGGVNYHLCSLRL